MIILICMIFGTAIAIWGQSLSYVFNDFLPEVDAITFLTILTVSSYLFYVCAIALTLYKIIKHNMKVNDLELLVVVVIVSLVMSGWSTFVLAMWWG